MNYLKKYLFLIASLWLNLLMGFSQNGKMKFEYLSINEGLSSNRITSFCRDSKNYMWIGTSSGLNRFDGHRVVTFTNSIANPRQYGPISGAHITCLMEDQQHQIWVGTSAGIYIYHSARDTFIKLRDTQNGGNFICSIFSDKKGTVWVLADTCNVLKKWMPGKLVFKNFEINRFKTNVPLQYKNAIGEDSKGNLWIGAIGKGIYAFNVKTEKFTNYDDPAIELTAGIAKGICVDNEDKVWIAAEHTGFLSFDPLSRTFKRYASNGKGTGTNGDFVYNIIQEDKNHLLIAVDQGGINRFNKIKGSFEYIMFDAQDRTGLNNNGVRQLYRDQEGILWVATSGGAVNYNNPKMYNFKSYSHDGNNNQSLCYNSIICLFEDSQGLIWIGTDGGGLSAFNPKTGGFKNYIHNPADDKSLSANVILCITEDKKHDLWMGTWEHGLIRYDRKNDRFINFMPEANNPASISGKSIWAIQADFSGKLWMNIWTEGIDIFDINKGVVERFRVNPKNSKDPKGILDNKIPSFFEDENHDMWICTWVGLNKYNYKLKTFSAYPQLANNLIKVITKAKDGTYWTGSDSRGVFLFRGDNEKSQFFNDSNGFPNNNISCILEDAHQNHWIASFGGITYVDARTHSFRNYTKYDGLLGTQFTCGLKTAKGEMYFGGPNGFNSFYPDSLQNNKFIPPVYITNFEIFNKKVAIRESGSPLTKDIRETDKISLQYWQSEFSFEFISINYTHPEKTQYAYKLEGFDKDWIHTDASRRFVTYNNLDAGVYTFRVKASNNDGVWNNIGRSLIITIIPPFWKTGWFIFLSGLLLVTFIGGFYYLKITRSKKQNILLKKMVLERTLEIQDKNNELQFHAQELNSINTLLEERQQHIEEQSEELTAQRDKLGELNATKDKLFSILAHDLRNPFHVIMGFSEILMRDYQRLGNEKIQRYVGLINSSSKRGNNLLENILQWTRSQTGRMLFDPEKLKLSNLVDESANLLEGEILSKHIIIEQLVSPSIEVSADKNMLKTILRNLLSNAVKFTPDHGKITMRASIKDKLLHFSIADTGIGIPEETLGKLFRVDTNISTKGTNQETGTGLGLLLCKEFVERHGGNIWCESTENRGSTFYFTLKILT